jgi:isopenicillin-N N-acyltransferase-like protein
VRDGNEQKVVFLTLLLSGEAQGQLLGPTIKQFIDEAWTYLEGQVEEVLKHVPPFLAQLIANFGLDVALDLTEDATRLYTPNAFYDSLKGVAAASGTNYRKLVRVHMLAGLTQGKCSCVGLWGKALGAKVFLFVCFLTFSAAPGSIKSMQLRALDWNMDGPFRNYAAVMVFHANKGEGNSFVTIGFPGFMGAMSGMNDQKVCDLIFFFFFFLSRFCSLQLARLECRIPIPRLGRRVASAFPLFSSCAKSCNTTRRWTARLSG